MLNDRVDKFYQSINIENKLKVQLDQNQTFNHQKK